MEKERRKHPTLEINNVQEDVLRKLDDIVRRLEELRADIEFEMSKLREEKFTLHWWI